MRIKAVILHLESTLVQKDILEAKALKAEIGCPPEISILDYVRGMSVSYTHLTLPTKRIV